MKNDRKKRIGIDIRKFNDFGIGIHIRNTLKYLSLIDNEFEYYLFHPNGFKLPDDLLGNTNGNWKFIKDDSPNYSIKELVTLPCKMLIKNLDLFHSPHYATPPLKPCAGVVTIHDIIHLLFPEFLPSYAAVKYARFMMKLATRKAKKIITVSENSKRDIVEHLKVPEEKIKVIYNAVEAKYFRISENSISQKLEKIYGIKGDYILYVGNHVPHKNLEQLFEAFSILMQAHEKPISLVVVCGGKEQVNNLDILGQRHKIDENLVLFGNLPYKELPIFYQGARVFVFPSLYEGFGLPVLESLACGTPAVISNNSSLPEVGGEASLYIDPNSANDIAEKISLLIKDSNLRERLSRKALEQAKKFSWEKAASLTMNVYREAMGIN